MEFYTQKLGFEIRVDLMYGSTRWVEVAPKGSQSTIRLMESVSQKGSKPEPQISKTKIGNPTGMWFYTEDINSTYDELNLKGIKISEPTQHVSMTVCSLSDEDGNSFYLISFNGVAWA